MRTEFILGAAGAQRGRTAPRSLRSNKVQIHISSTSSNRVGSLTSNKLEWARARSSLLMSTCLQYRRGAKLTTLLIRGSIRMIWILAVIANWLNRIRNFHYSTQIVSQRQEKEAPIMFKGAPTSSYMGLTSQAGMGAAVTRETMDWAHLTSRVISWASASKIRSRVLS